MKEKKQYLFGYYRWNVCLKDLTNNLKVMNSLDQTEYVSSGVSVIQLTVKFYCSLRKDSFQVLCCFIILQVKLSEGIYYG